MARQKTVELIEELVLPIVEEAGLELADVEFVKEGSRWCLRVFIDKPGGIGIEDCRYISEKLDKLLDEKDPIPHSYALEVSSPGIERPLKKPADYVRFTGRLANITTFAPLDGKKNFSGRIIGISGNNLVLDTEGTEFSVPLDQVASARLVVEF